MDDTMIIDMYWRRDEEAITQTAQKYGSYCHGISFNILHCREDAEECVNDTYEHAWSSIPPERPCRFKTWLGTVTRNLAINRWKKNRAQKRCDEFSVLLSELDDCVPAGESVEKIAAVKALGEAIDRWLSELSEADRALFLRRYWYGDTVSAIAKSNGLSANALTQRLYRMRCGLKRHLEKEGAII